MFSVGKAFLASLLLASTTSDAARIVVATVFVRESGRKPSNSKPGTDWMYLSRRSVGRLALPVSNVSSGQSEKRADMRRIHVLRRVGLFLRDCLWFLQDVRVPFWPHVSVWASIRGRIE